MRTEKLHVYLHTTEKRKPLSKMDSNNNRLVSIFVFDSDLPWRSSPFQKVALENRILSSICQSAAFWGLRLPHTVTVPAGCWDLSPEQSATPFQSSYYGRMGERLPPAIFSSHYLVLGFVAIFPICGPPTHPLLWIGMAIWGCVVYKVGAVNLLRGYSNLCLLIICQLPSTAQC